RPAPLVPVAPPTAGPAGLRSTVPDDRVPPLTPTTVHRPQPAPLQPSLTPAPGWKPTVSRSAPRAPERGATAAPAGATVAGQARPELPRRNPQTHLSPRLAGEPQPASRGQARPVPDLADAELARSRMSALQRGTMRGRAADPEVPR
ncbi:MAG TPA: hypothetical protein VI248_11275, partial [Kineosporiaceae bacterium]